MNVITAICYVLCGIFIGFLVGLWVNYKQMLAIIDKTFELFDESLKRLADEEAKEWPLNAPKTDFKFLRVKIFNESIRNGIRGKNKGITRRINEREVMEVGRYQMD